MAKTLDSFGALDQFANQPLHWPDEFRQFRYSVLSVPIPNIVVQKSFVLKLDLPSNCEQRLKFRLVKGTNFLVTFVFFFHQALQGFRLPWHSLQAFPQVLPE